MLLGPAMLASPAGCKFQTVYTMGPIWVGPGGHLALFCGPSGWLLGLLQKNFETMPYVFCVVSMFSRQSLEKICLGEILIMPRHLLDIIWIQQRFNPRELDVAPPLSSPPPPPPPLF